MISQFDVFANPVPASAKNFPLVCVLQSDFAGDGRHRIVAFLAKAALAPGGQDMIMPVVEVSGERYLLLLPSMTSFRCSLLKTSSGSISSYRDKILRGLDWLFLGN